MLRRCYLILKILVVGKEEKQRNKANLMLIRFLLLLEAE